MDTLLDIFIVSAMVFSVFSNLFGFPGNITLAFSSLFYGVTTGFEEYSLTFVLALFGIVIFLEAIEFLLISFTAKKYGSSNWGVSGAIIGGILGAVSGAFVTLVVGTIVGSFLGVFIGAFGFELIKKKNIKNALLAGSGAFLGKIGGISLKMVGAMTMVSWIVYKII